MMRTIRIAAAVIAVSGMTASLGAAQAAVKG